MAASPLDTLAAADELRNAGFDERQARAIVALQNSAHTTLATKTDLTTEIDRSTTTMKAELAAAIEPLATKAELAAAVEPLATKAELAAAIEPLATKAELAIAIEPLATKAELAIAIQAAGDQSGPRTPRRTERQPGRSVLHDEVDDGFHRRRGAGHGRTPVRHRVTPTDTCPPKHAETRQFVVSAAYLRPPRPKRSVPTGEDDHADRNRKVVQRDQGATASSRPTTARRTPSVHISAVERAGLGTLREGQRVSYELAPPGATASSPPKTSRLTTEAAASIPCGPVHDPGLRDPVSRTKRPIRINRR